MGKPLPPFRQQWALNGGRSDLLCRIDDPFRTSHTEIVQARKLARQRNAVLSQSVTP